MKQERRKIMTALIMSSLLSLGFVVRRLMPRSLQNPAPGR